MDQHHPTGISMIRSKLRHYLNLSDNSHLQQEIESLYDETDAQLDTSSYSMYSSTLEKELRELRTAVKAAEIQLAEQDDGYSSTDPLTADHVAAKTEAVRQSLDQVPAHLSTFSSISRILAIDRLETVNRGTETALELMKEQQNVLQKQFARETKLNKELKSLMSLLRLRLQQVTNNEPSSSSLSPEDIISRLQDVEKRELLQYRKKTNELRVLVESLAAPIIVRSTKSSLTLEDVIENLQELIRTLLNEMFENGVSGGYVEVAEPYNPLVKFLLNGDLITVKANDPTSIRLREFGV